ncbi:MAG TPA: Na+/H+ antiporter NhaA, partial [Polyangiaceae bacterium]
MTQRDESPQPPDSVPRTLPPEAWKPIVGLARLTKRRLDRFFRIEAAGGVVLLVAAALALAWANSPWAKSYAALWHMRVSLRVGSLAFESSLEWLVNDVLMAIFFFVVGMEIRRELHDGELSEWRRAVLPAVAAVGGMLVPTVVYLVLVGEPRAHSGWGVPMATDIAFAVGVLALLGRRAPPALRVLLLALAVIDDLGAILVIAFFYSPGIQLSGLLIAAVGVALILALRATGVRAFSAYAVPAVVVWVGVHASGIHPTIAGVIVGLLTPVRAWRRPDAFVKEAHEQAQRLSDELARSHSSSRELQEPMNRVAFAGRESLSPAELLIEALNPWIAFLIMPVFALANAGVDLRGIVFTGATVKVSIAIATALVLGKPLGIVVVSLLAIWSGLSALPTGLNVRHLAVLGTVAGIGFTMSLFIAQLAFIDASLLAAAKLGVLVASAVAMVVGLLLGRAVLP